MWAECGWSVGQRKAIRQMWVECGATKSNKANVGGVWGNAKKQNKCGASAKRVQKSQKWQSKGQKQFKCG